MRLDNKQVVANIISQGDNIILCSNLQEAFFDIYNLDIQGETFIKKASYAADGCPVITLDVEYNGSLYSDVEFKLQQSKEEGIFINENHLVYGTAYQAPNASAQLTEALFEPVFEPEPQPPAPIIEITPQVSAAQLKEQAVAAQEKRIKKMLRNIENKINENVQQQLYDAKSSMLQETLLQQVNLQRSAAKEVDAATSNINNKFESLQKQLQQHMQQFTQSAVDGFKSSVVEECNALLQENSKLSLLELSQDVKSSAVKARASVYTALEQKLNSKFQELLNVADNSNADIKKFVEEQVQQLQQDIKQQQLQVFEETTNELLFKQHKFVDEVVNDKVKFVEQAVETLKQQNQQEIQQQSQLLQSSVNEKLDIANKQIDQLVSNASQQLTEHVDQLNAQRLLTIEQQVEQILQQQFNQAAETQVVEEGTQNTAITKAINNFKNQLNVDLQKQAANLQSELYRKFAVYVESMGGGGGSVAVQYANGGTMNGTLNVTSGQILSGGIDLYDIFSTSTSSGFQTLAFNENTAALTISPNGNTISLSALSGTNGGTTGAYLPLSGGTVTGTTIFTGTLSATLIEAISANITVIDIKQYELSGFNVEGNVTVSGTVSSNNVVYAAGGNSNNWNSSYTTTNAQSSNWSSVYTTVNAYSATNWNYQGTDIKALTANWQNTHTTVQSNSAQWATDSTTDVGVRALTANWQNTYTSFSTQSAANAAVYSTVNTNSASWGGGSGVSYLSALNDVNIPAPVNGQVLTYNSILNKWTAGSPLSAAGSTGYYGSFYDTTSQTLTSGNQAKLLAIADTYESNGIALSSSKIVFSNSGTYEIIFSIQYKNASNAQEDIYVWFRKNGQDVAESSSIFTIPAEKNSNIPGKLIAVTPFIATLSGGDYIEIYWHCNSTDVSVAAFTTHTNPTIPDTPGVIVTVKQVTNVQTASVSGYLPLSGGTLTGVLSTNQDIEITDSTKGIILKSPSNFKYRVTVTDAGELVTTLV